MKPNIEQLIEAVVRISVLKFAPSGDAAQREIMRLLDRMVATQVQLDWLIQTLIDHVGEWPGTKELRGIFCTRFKPADGVEEYCSIRGFTAEDIESGNSSKALPSGSQRALGTTTRLMLPLLPEGRRVSADKGLDLLVRNATIGHKMLEPTEEDRECSRKLLGNV